MFIVNVDGVVLYDYDIERDRRSAIRLGRISCFILTANELVMDDFRWRWVVVICLWHGKRWRSLIWSGWISCFILTANALFIDNVDGVVLHDYDMERDRKELYY